MKKKVSLFVLLAMLLLTIAPVAVSQASEKSERQFEGVALADTNYEEISFTNIEQELQLGGMLFRPDVEGPYPAVVFIHGGGTSMRDNPWYLTLVQYLQENGVLVLLPDKRGSEKSEGDWHKASFTDLATDTVAAVQYLKGRKDLAISHIGIVGASQGGQFSPLVASLSPDVEFLVNIVGAAVPIYDQLLFEENYNLRQIGFLPGISNVITYPSVWSIREVRQAEFWDNVGNFDPLPYWRQLQIPALSLYGQEDTNVPAGASAAILQSLSKEDVQVKVYVGSGHKLEDPEGQGDRIVREEALRDIRDFIFSITSRQG